jgi:peptide/nickel transport system substrate-binding protein
VTNIKKGGHLTEGFIGEPRTFNPVLSSDANSAAVLQLVFDPLVYLDPDTLEPRPRLAKGWDTSPDGTVYTFHFAPGITWHDGQPFTADDVKLTYDLLMNPATGTPRAGVLNQRIAKVEVIDPLTVAFTTKGINPLFFAADTSSYGIVPKHLLDGVKPEEIRSHRFSTSAPVGTGPFAFKEYLPGDHLTLTANPRYHRGAPALDAYVYKVAKDSTTLYQQLKTGEVDYAPIPPDFYEDVRKQPNLSAVAYDTFGMRYFGFNLDPAKTPLFQDVRVRQALCYALDRQGVVDKVLNGLSTYAVGTQPVRSWAYEPEKITVRYDYDLQKANALLDAAGWARGADGIRAKEGRRLAFTCYAPSGDKAKERALTVFQENWKAVGVAMTPQYEEYSTFISRISSAFDYELFYHDLASWVVGDPNQQIMFDSNQKGGFNWMSYRNPQVDALDAEALKTLDREKRRPLYLEVQNLVLADAPVFVTDFPKGITGVNTRVKNRIPDAAPRTSNAHQWYVTDGK